MSERIKFGRTDLEVSPICFGTWQLSPVFWGEQDHDVITAAIHRAFELGVNFFDTAQAYGDGISETVTGRALADLPRDEIVVCTKVYWRYPPSGERYMDLSKENILDYCDTALRRLRMDYIDILLAHSFDPLTDPRETIDGLETLLKQGKVRHYGVSNWTVEQMRLGISAGGNYSACQPPYDLIHREKESDVLPFCYSENIGVMVYSSLRRGLLTGKYKGGETFDDLRKGMSDFQGDRFKKLCDAVAKIPDIAKAYGLTTVQTVLAATLMHPGIHSAIVGIKTSAQIEEAVGSMGKTISREDYCKLRDLLSL